MVADSGLPARADAAGDITIMSDDDDMPELTAEDFARGRPFAEVFPEHSRAWRKHGRTEEPAPRGSGRLSFASRCHAGYRDDRPLLMSAC